MRHLATVLAALIIGPIAWVLLALGQDRSAQVFGEVQAGNAQPRDFLGPLAFLVVAGATLGLLGTLRVSPLGAALTGIGFLGSYLATLAAPRRVVDMLDHTLTIYGNQANLATPVRTGASAVLGSLLLIAVFSARRWRRWPQPAEDTMDSLLPDGPAADRPTAAYTYDRQEPIGAAQRHWAKVARDSS